MQIREAKVSDMRAIWGYIQEVHFRTSYADIPLDQKTWSDTVGFAINGKQSKVWISLDDDGSVVGILAGIVDTLFFSKKKLATDIVFVADQGGSQLLDAFLEWAKQQPGVRQILMGVSNALGAKQAGALMVAKGMERVGGMYEMRVN